MHEKIYDEVLGEVRGLWEGMPGRQERQAAQVRFCWRLGKRLADWEGPVWGKELVKRLSADLTALYGEGFSTSNLFSMKKCARIYAEEDLDPGLGWSHYRVLVTVEDRQSRELLARRIKEEGLGCRDVALEASRLRVARAGGRDWTLRRGRTGVYRLERGWDGGVFLDGGFGLKLDPALWGVGRLDPAMESGTLVALDGTRLVALEGEVDSYRHCYGGEVVRVVDGDTVLVDMERAPGVRMRIKVRLWGVDAEEGSTESGARASLILEGLVPPGTEVRVLTRGLDTHGRWIGDVLTGPWEWSLTTETPGLIYVNRSLAEMSGGTVAERSWGA